MGLGLVLGALAGAGKGVSDAAQDYQRAQTSEQAAQANAERETAMAKTRADLQVEASNRIAEANRAREQEPIKRFQSTVSDLVKKYTEDPSLIPAELLPKQAPVAAEDAKPAEGFETVGFDVSKLTSEQVEYLKKNDPAAYEAGIKAFDASGRDANAPIATKMTPEVIREAAFLAATEEARVNDPIAYKAIGDALKGEMIHIGTGGAVMNPITRKVEYQNTTAKDIAEAKIKAAAEAQEKKIAADEEKSDKQIAARERMAEMKMNSAAAAKTVDPKIVDDMAQAIASYQLPMPSGRVQATPYGQALMGKVLSLRPDYNGADYDAMKKVIVNFAGGKEGTAVKNINTAVDHLTTLRSLVENLDNTKSPAFNAAANYISQWSGKENVTNFNSAKDLIADEVLKGVIGSAGGVTDREKTAENIKAMNSPAQLLGSISTFEHLMAGQAKTLENQYRANTGRTDFNKLLLPATIEALSKASGGDHGGKATTVQNPMTAPKAAVNGVIDFGSLK